MNGKKDKEKSIKEIDLVCDEDSISDHDTEDDEELLKVSTDPDMRHFEEYFVACPECDFNKHFIVIK